METVIGSSGACGFAVLTQGHTSTLIQIAKGVTTLLLREGALKNIRMY